MRVAYIHPFHTTYYLNGHSFIEQELTRAGIRFRKDDNAFLAVDDLARPPSRRRPPQPDHYPPAARLLDARARAEVLRSERQAMYLRRGYFVSQIEYCRNFIFKRRFPDPHAL